MPVSITPDELEFIRTVERLAAGGCTYTEIARTLSVPQSTIIYRLRKHGLHVERQIRDRITGRSVDQLLEDGDLAVYEPVGAAEVTA